MSLLLPEKEYHDLQDIAGRWHVSLADLQYYAVHNHLKIMVWLSQPVVNVYHLKKTEDGEDVPVVYGYRPYKGYAVLAPDELRGVFRDGSCHIKKFIDPANQNLLEINPAGYQVNINDLVVSHQELDKFEQRHTKPCPCEPDGNACRTVSFTGRPSAMHHVRQHFMERCARKEVLPSLQKEADYLSEWAARNIKDAPLPKTKTIKNVLRADYRRYSDSLAFDMPCADMLKMA